MPMWPSTTLNEWQYPDYSKNDQWEYEKDDTYNEDEKDNGFGRNIETADQFATYLNKNYASVDTPMGTMKMTHKINENNYSTSWYDFRITTDWSELSPYDIQYSLKYSDSEKEETIEQLKTVQKAIYADVTTYFPTKKS